MEAWIEPGRGMIALKDYKTLLKVTFSLHGTCYDKMTKLSLGGGLHLTWSTNIEEHQKSCDRVFFTNYYLVLTNVLITAKASVNSHCNNFIS